MDAKVLTEKDRREINAALYRLREVQFHIDALTALGEGDDELLARREHVIQQLDALKAHYFQGKP